MDMLGAGMLSSVRRLFLSWRLSSNYYIIKISILVCCPYLRGSVMGSSTVPEYMLLMIHVGIQEGLCGSVHASPTTDQIV